MYCRLLLIYTRCDWFNEWKTEKRQECAKYGESKTTRIMMATVPHVISGLGLENFRPMDFWWYECTFCWLKYRLISFLHPSNYFKVNVQQFYYRPGQAMRVPGGWGPQISRQLAHEGNKFVSPKHRPPLLSQDISLVFISLKRLSQLQDLNAAGRMSMTPSGMAPATFRLAAQCLNQLRYRVSQIILIEGSN